MRTLTEIIIHCSDTYCELDFKAADIDRWHKKRGFDCIGYHYVIDLDGTIEIGRPIERCGAHCLGHNANSVGICYIGGRTHKGRPIRHGDTRTAAQIVAMHKLVFELLLKYPSINRVVGHNYYNRLKACPCFDAEQAFQHLLPNTWSDETKNV